MQNRYVGDIGDFGKYHLLKILSQGNGLDNGGNLVLGVVWYLVPNENHNGDGKHIRYLQKSGSNSIRFSKTFGYWDYQQGIDITLLMKIFNHSAPSITLRYIGITQDDINNVYVNLNL